jgi:Protein of unknown function (DUF2889)
MNAPQKFPFARNPIGPAPLRRPGSTRRTSSIDSSWPEGFGKPVLMQGHARDVLTPADGGAPVVLEEDRYSILVSPERVILSITVTPDRPHAQRLVGIRAGGQSRSAITEIMSEDREKGTPLFLILDDFAGASLVAGWVWSNWIDNWAEQMQKATADGKLGKRGSMEGVCTGFSPGSSALQRESGAPADQSSTVVPSLIHPDDPDGWHTLAVQEGVGMRRARRIDVWREGGELAIDVGFQDSGTQRDSEERVAIHEYHVRASTKAGAVSSLKIDPRILPFRECPGAAANAQRMLGTPLCDLRAKVLETLPGTLGCTHLNDVLRSMAEVPQLASQLPQ